MQEIKERLKDKQCLANEIGTLHEALEGALSLAGAAYQEEDRDARHALPKIQAMIELIADRLKTVHVVVIEDSA
jgi:hypothetical protein